MTALLVLWSFWMLGHDELPLLRRPLSLPEAPYMYQVLIGMNVVNLILLVAMSVACFALITSKPYGVSLFTTVFVGFFCYLVLLALVPGRSPFASSFAAAYGVGNLPLSPLLLWPVPFLLWRGVRLVGSAFSEQAPSRMTISKSPSHK
ncbi:hypothetical protein [Candidatus Korobacter versatilis]|uniref:hypothetical protein n=1 Tax=Candidatus Korobacter versatilis TaxID=658062 RepID=UPI0011D177D8|nr:hypothetical protein [Candidatus Koribacter versatilis]